MKLAVFSYKVCWRDESSPSGYSTDGGFPIQMRTLSGLFGETRLVVPVDRAPSRNPAALTHVTGNSLSVIPLPMPRGEDWKRKLSLPGWLLKAAPTMARQLVWADAVHAPIPGDIGTFGMLGAQLSGKPLFVRHCGNWRVQATVAEHLWKYFMIQFAGGRNVMLATGGGDDSPCETNPNVAWIFSTSSVKPTWTESRQGISIKTA